MYFYYFNYIIMKSTLLDLQTKNVYGEDCYLFTDSEGVKHNVVRTWNLEFVEPKFIDGEHTREEIDVLPY